MPTELLKIKWGFPKPSGTSTDLKDIFILCADIFIGSGEPNFGGEVTAKQAPICS